MDKTKLEQYAEIQAMVQKEARDIAEQVYQEKAAQFGVPKVAVHIHNGVDSPMIPGSNIVEVKPLNGIPEGVLNAANLNSQTYTFLGNINYPVVPAFPLVEIQGYGVGVHSAFEGGDAPLGTMVLFTNGNTLSKLCIRSDASTTGWFGATLSTI